jgi:crotonobetainyl-CoA:carnitine CoA-transferase CaiB-like acyl-CoA transferase
MVAELAQPGAQRPVRLLGVPIKLSRTPGDPNRRPGPGLGEQTDAVLGALGYDEAQVAALKEAGAVAGPVAQESGPATRSFRA